MSIAFLTLTCILTLAAATWAHALIRTHTHSTRMVTHSALAVVGIAFGLVMAFVYTESTGIQRWLVFLCSFGVVHVPAAFILQLKHLRHKDRD